MKQVILAVITGAFTMTAQAQQKDIFKNKPWEDAKLKMLSEKHLPHLLTAPSAKVPAAISESKGVLRLPLMGTFNGTNPKGDEVYAMQTDYMPCLVPGKAFHSNMPVAGVERTDKTLLPQLQKENDQSLDPDKSKR